MQEMNIRKNNSRAHEKCPTRGCRRLRQGSKSQRWNAVLEFLLKYQQQAGSDQAPPASPGEAGAGLSHQPLGNQIFDLFK
jgi:hypothetical protein